MTTSNNLPTCTENELNLLYAIATSDFQDCNPIAENAVWVWSVEFPSASHGGTASSLTQKGMIGTQSDPLDGDVCWLTQAGVDALLAAGRVVLREDGSIDSRATRALTAPAAPPVADPLLDVLDAVAAEPAPARTTIVRDNLDGTWTVVEAGVEVATLVIAPTGKRSVSVDVHPIDDMGSTIEAIAFNGVARCDGDRMHVDTDLAFKPTERGRRFVCTWIRHSSDPLV